MPDQTNPRMTSMTAWKKVEQGTGCQAPVPCENNKTISDTTNTNHCHRQLHLRPKLAVWQNYFMDAY